MSVVDVPAMWQIMVQPGDVIGLQLPLGETGVVWDACTPDLGTDVFDLKYGWTNPEPGDSYSFTSVGDDFPCRLYSVSAMMEQG